MYINYTISKFIVFVRICKSLEKRLTNKRRTSRRNVLDIWSGKKRSEEMVTNIKGEVVWMANKFIERKRIITLLAVSLAVAVGVKIWIALR